MAKAYRPLAVPKGIEFKVQTDQVTVKGKLGTLTIPVRTGLTVKVEPAGVSIDAAAGVERAHTGTLRAHIRNAVTGVADGYTKALEVRGMGYRVQKTKDGVQISCGYSHPVDVPAPAGVTFDVGQAPDPDDAKIQMSIITVKGIDRHAVGKVAAEIRAIKPPDCYQGKGIRYQGERVVKKAGKRAAGTQA
jgi:large subunit ribosomal protein L6